MISCFTNSYGRFGVPAAIAHVRSAGIRFVELAIKTEGVPSIFHEVPLLTDQSGDRDIAKVRQMLDEHDVLLSSCNITSGNPLDESVVEITSRKLAIAAKLGVSLVVAGAGGAVTPEEESTLFEHLCQIGDMAGKRGITYCFETHPGLCRNASGMLRTMEHLDHPHLRLNFDTGNILFYNEGADVPDELEQVLPYVKHVHLKDHRGAAGEWCFPALGAGGNVDFARVVELLHGIGYDGPMSLEIEGIQGEAELTLDQTHQRVVDSVVHLRSCGLHIEQQPSSSS
ncbi:MAG: sugar phosphate isomerase/epimerase family protein [Planctomycetaceae bacterium]